MIYPLIEFGSFVFCLVTGLVLLWVLISIYVGASNQALVLAIVWAVLYGALVSGTPVPDWRYLAGYLVGAFVWIPAYWYLRLKKNARTLNRLKSEAQALGKLVNQYQMRNYGEHISPGDGPESWLPKHPSNADLSIEGLMWPVAAPLYLAEDWINIIIDFFRGFMDRVQDSLKVTIEK